MISTKPKMFPNNSFSANPDSDQSISDEDEEVDRAWPENSVSLAEISDSKKRNAGVASVLELLKGFFSDDDVEAPDFDGKRDMDSNGKAAGHPISLEKDDSTSDIDEQLSGDEGSKMPSNSDIAGCNVSEILDRYARGKQKQFDSCTSFAADEYARRPGGKPMNKVRSSSHCQQHKKGSFWPSAWNPKDHNSSRDPVNEFKSRKYCLADKSISEDVGSSACKQISESVLASPLEADIQHDHSRHSMVELLDGLQGKRRNPHFKRKMVARRKGRMEQQTVIGIDSLSGKDIMSDEDSCELYGESSTDNEDKAQCPELAVGGSGRRTFADKFHEAFGSSVDCRGTSFIVLNHSSNGVFGRLQQVLQKQKERDMELKNLQADAWPKGEARCLDVKILSRSFDAKLIVSQCSLLENEESSLENPQHENFGKIWSVIFSPRVCSDVDLEVANLIRIHPPWKEVQVLKGSEIIILATYYSQIFT